MAAFGIGYLLGTKAGRQRYGQIVAAATRASERLEAYSGRSANGSGTRSGAVRPGARS